MILKKMILPGRFVQAHPYFDTLWLVRMDGTLQAFDTEQYVTAVMNGTGSAAAKAFARNDRLVTDNGIAHLRDQTPDVAAFLTSGMDVEVSLKDLERFSYTFEREDMLEEAIDLKFYSGRAYASTDRGLAVFRALGREDLDSTPLGRGGHTAAELDIWIDAMPLQIQARLGTISASCGEDGGWYWTGANSSQNRLRLPERKFADLSFASEFAGAGLVNIEGPVQLSARPATKIAVDDRTRATRGEVPERQEIVDIEAAADPVANVRFDRLAQDHESVDVRATQTFVTTRRAYVYYSDDTVSHFTIANKEGFEHGASNLQRAEGPGGRILSMTTTAGRVIAECRDDVRLFDSGSWQPIHDGPVFSVRGYPQSKWYRNIVTVVGEDRVEIILLVRDD